MALTNYERVGKALDLLKRGLGPFVEREVHAYVEQHGLTDTMRRFAEDANLRDLPVSGWDASALLRFMTTGEVWNEVFRATLGHAERSFASELREVRNRWAHQQPFSGDDAYRALDSTARLLAAVSAPEAEEIERMKQELLRVRYDEQVRSEKRRAAGTAIESQGAGGLKPWREVATPHRDVASGRYQQAEFAADLWQVHLGEGADEYRDPAEFFRRTYLTESLRRLLVGAARRLTGGDGDPVVQLQTNFGGGKTHSMLALYHLFSGADPTRLLGVEGVLEEAGVGALPRAHRVVLVGNKISPGNPSVKPDGTAVRTLWGELAWQLGFGAGGLEEARRAYERVRADDEHATNPGDTLRALFNDYGPCLVLIDEWVAYARQLHEQGGLPGGSFETQFSFAQALTESAKLAKHCLLVISLPASDTATAHAHADDVEVGGTRGREALQRLQNVIGRVESSWRPASAEEGFEIVRRRLFEPMTDPQQFRDRDVVARAFGDLYRTQHAEFPLECRAPDYERRIQAAYPIHPEVFDRLYTDWSTLVKFQRTRGVLRLMAAVIHSLWEAGDRTPLILPASLPIDDPRVQFELTRYLSDNWVPIIEKDVDGPASLPRRIDAEVPNLGKYAAARRVARTIYLGSAPTTTAANRGLEDRRIRLGCVLPGETPAVFGDALRRLAAGATYLYQDGARYWYSTQPTVTKLAEDLAEQIGRDADRVAQEVNRRLRADLAQKGEFSRIHALPGSSGDVPDDLEARLVVLGIEQPYGRDGASEAERAAQAILETHGSRPRLYRNTLVFLAADKTRRDDLTSAVCTYLAWDAILADRETLDLSPHQVRQAETQRAAADAAVKARLPETFQWLLVPGQANPQAPVAWQAVRLTGQDALAVRASKRLKSDELLVAAYGASILRHEMDRVPLWRSDHVAIRQLAEDFGSYLYLPRLKDPSVLAGAIRAGISTITWEQDGFAYADAYDEAAGRYRGLRAGEAMLIGADDPGLLVRPEVARRQREAEAAAAQPAAPSAAAPPGTAEAPAGLGTPWPASPVPGGVTPSSESAEGGTLVGAGPAGPLRPRRYHGTVELDAARVGRDAGRVAEEVLAHLVGLVGSKVRVTLEIEAEVPDGAPEHVVRTVTENSRTLKFTSHGFEAE